MKFKFLFLAAVLVSGLSHAQKKIEFTEFDLDNGMHVILHKDNSTPIVAVTMLYHVGSKNEKPDRTGFAHFFEHLLFEGSANIGRHKFDKYVEGAGGVLNANTSFDRTFYYVLMPSNQLELGLWLESERLLHAKVENIGIETQREVVKEEKRQRMDNQPYGSMLENIFSRAYKVHPYRWITIGSMEHLNAAQEDDYVNFYKTFYVPNNVTLSIAGDIDLKETQELVNKYFSDVPSGERLSVYRDLLRLERKDFLKRYNQNREADKEWSNMIDSLHPFEFMDQYLPGLSTTPNTVPRPDVVEPPLGGEIRDTVYDEIQLPAVFHAYRIPAQGTDDFYAMSMLNTLLSSGQSSRFTKKIVDEELAALFVGAFAFPAEDPGLNITMAICSMTSDPQQVESLIDTELKRVKDDLITERELQKLRNQMENRFFSSNSTMAGIAESLANYHTYYGSADLINTEIDKYMAVTREDIQRVAKKYLVPENRVVLHYLPKEEE